MSPGERRSRSADTVRTHERGGLSTYVPILRWLPGYERRWLVADAVAGLSVWALLVPQSLAYATIVGVPVQYGLYTAFAALLAYPLFGTSKHLVVGPSATVGAVSAAVVTPLIGAAALGTDEAASTQRRWRSPPQSSTSRSASCAWGGSPRFCRRRSCLASSSVSRSGS